MKLSLAGYEILGWKFFSLRMLNIGPHSLLACRVFAERSAVSLMGFPLWVTQPIFLAALSIFSFISTLVNLMIMCLEVVLLEEYLCGVLCISWIWMLACLARMGKFSWITSWSAFSSLFPLSLSPSCSPINHRINLFTIVPYFLKSLFIPFYSFLSNLVCMPYFSKMVFKLWYVLFCLVDLALLITVYIVKFLCCFQLYHVIYASF